ncbi:MAG: polyprenyl synthetase family protein [Spirochaetia bacterium]|nr:polyprenyl synthetase family protein [Spirochaetia bacterium]
MRLAKIEEYLQTILPEKVNKSWKEAVMGPAVVKDEFLNQINDPARDLLNRGGKRWRPLLMMLFYQLYRSDDDILPLTPLVELPHNGSLIIDDIEDSSDFRRGKPAVHLLYGIDLSINTGNFLYFLPHICIDSCNFSDDIKLAAYRYYNEGVTKLHIGQGLDILWHRDKDYIPSVDEYMTMCCFKTGGLAQLSGLLGVRAGGGSEETALVIGEACKQMGVGFQILDDVINLTVGNPGKKRGDDIVEGKKSLPVILYSQMGGEMIRLKEIFAYAGEHGIDKAGSEVEEAIALIKATGAIEAAKEKAIAILKESRDTIMISFKPSPVLDDISTLFDSFLKPFKGEVR